MAKLKWDQIGEKKYHTGTDQGVLYKPDETGAYAHGFAWNGLTGFTKSPSGAEPTALWADNIKYLSLMSAEEFKGTITAYMYPNEFDECNGFREVAPGVIVGQQARTPFGFSCRSIVGNDVKDKEYGYIIHCLYGCKASPSEEAYETVNDSPSGIEFSWEVDCTPVNVAGFAPTATLDIDSTRISATALTKLKNILYGTETEEPRLPLPDEILEIIKEDTES